MSQGKIDLSEVSEFDKGKLSHAETTVKDHLPCAGELSHDKTLKGIQDFNKGVNLKNVSTVEKNPLPTKEDIESEKKSGF